MPRNCPPSRSSRELGRRSAVCRNFIAVGLNYADHAAETGAPIPAEPILFNKAPNCIVGPNDDVDDPEGLDEDRLGSRARHRHRRAAPLRHRGRRALSRRRLLRLQRRLRARFPDRARRPVDQGQRLRDLRPARPLVGRDQDEIADVQNLSMWLDVNGERCQTGSTATMIFGVAKIVSYVVAVHDADARRRHHHRHAARRRPRHEAAEIPRRAAT